MDRVDTARQRLAKVYDPRLFSTAAEQWAASLGTHLATVQGGHGPVLNWTDPPALVARARQILDRQRLDPLALNEEAFAHRVTDLLREALAHGNNLHHPRYVGHQVPASVPLAGLFDALGAVTNQVMAIYEMGPWATAVERALIERLGQAIGWPADSFAGLVTHGGSLANLTALLTARNVALKTAWTAGLRAQGAQPVVLVHSDAHYSVARAVGILGIGTEHLVRVPLDGRRRMDPAALDRLLSDLRRAGRPVIAVAAAACATPIGAFDPLEDIAEVCRRHRVWLHVDAAHGGAACFSRRHRRLVAGLELADSVVCDAHKMMFVPALCAFVFYRQAAHRFAAFEQDAPYLFDPSAPGVADYDSGLKTIECTKRAATFGLWGLWSLFGPQLFEDLVDVTYDLGRRLYDRLQAAEDFEALHEPQCNIVAFRYRPAALRAASGEALGRFQWALRRRVVESGEAYLVPTRFERVGALRATLINPLTTESDLDDLLALLRRHGTALLAESVA